MFGNPGRDGAAPKSATATAAPNTAVVMTLAALPSERHVIDQLAWSYGATPTGGNVTINGIINGAAAADVFDLAVTAGGGDFVDFPHGLAFDPNTAVVITLAAGGAGVTGYLNVQYR